jgi:AcrR family transcriptional regulator
MPTTRKSADKVMKKRDSRAEDRRARILSAARQLFTQYGFHASGVARIAADSGVKVGQLYRDFACKEDIVAELVRADVVEFLDEPALREAVEARDFALVRAWIARFLEEDPNDPGSYALFAEMFAEATRNDRVGDIMREVDALVRGNILSALDALAPGEERAARRSELADFILAVGHGVLFRRISDPDVHHAELSRYIGQLIDSELAKIMQDPPVNPTR